MRLIPYEDAYQPVFRQLNLEWLDHYGLTEPYDLKILDDPRSTVLDPGGFIWLVEAEGEIVGTAGLAKEADGVFELIKMAVTESYQGRGISRMLIEACLSQARAMGAKKVTLYSNHQLSRAIALYEKYGFRPVELGQSPMQTADVRMELIL